jgi:hypothetical protein
VRRREIAEILVDSTRASFKVLLSVPEGFSNVPARPGAPARPASKTFHEALVESTVVQYGTRRISAISRLPESDLRVDVSKVK